MLVGSLKHCKILRVDKNETSYTSVFQDEEWSAMAMKRVSVGSFFIDETSPLTLISGPCVMEDRDHTLFCVERLLEITSKRRVQFIFKASYDKANRTSIHSFRGPGLEKGLTLLEEIKRNFHVPVLSDIHTVEEVKAAAQVLDVLQIPAFLCRQTDLIVAAAETGKPLHIKKGQFVSPDAMKHAVEKAASCGNDQVILCERGSCFGYNNLVCDMRALPIMRSFQVPVSFDASHSVQMPASLGNATGGTREHIPCLARAAAAAGIQVLFIESHPDPVRAKSDAATVFPLNALGDLLDVVIDIHERVRGL